MASKKQKERKKKIQERQKVGRQSQGIRTLLDKQSELIRKTAGAEEDARKLRLSSAALGKKVLDLERKLRARDKDVVDMHNNHVKMRESLTSIRELHMPMAPTYDPDDAVACNECGHRWPCPTYLRIKTPDHLVVTNLLRMVADLDKEYE